MEHGLRSEQCAWRGGAGDGMHAARADRVDSVLRY